MNSNPDEFRLVTIEPTTVAVVHEIVPMKALGEFFARAFTAAMDAAAAEGIPIVGPPLGIYYGEPASTVNLSAGFPTAYPVTRTAQVGAETLPGGRAVKALHVGPYDTLRATYDRLLAWADAQGLRLADVVWESYLTDPEEAGPDATQTLLTYAVVD